MTGSRRMGTADIGGGWDFWFWRRGHPPLALGSAVQRPVLSCGGSKREVTVRLGRARALAPSPCSCPQSTPSGWFGSCHTPAQIPSLESPKPLSLALKALPALAEDHLCSCNPTISPPTPAQQLSSLQFPGGSAHTHTPRSLCVLSPAGNAGSLWLILSPPDPSEAGLPVPLYSNPWLFSLHSIPHPLPQQMVSFVSLPGMHSISLCLVGRPDYIPPPTLPAAALSSQKTGGEPGVCVHVYACLCVCAHMCAW